MEQSPARAREGKEELDGVENSLKVYIGRVQALGDPAFMGKIAAAEADLKAKSRRNKALGNPWGDVATATAAYRDIYLPYRFIAPSSDLYAYAHTLVRAAAERAKPNGERLPGFSDSALPLVEKQLLDARPITPWLDRLKLEWSLSKAREYLGPDDAQVRLMLGKESPEGLAARLVSTSRLADPAVRKQLWNGGQAAIAASRDPMIVLARKLDARERELQAQVDETYLGPVTAAQARIADARFAA
jgi:hypothetical protein